MMIHVFWNSKHYPAGLFIHERMAGLKPEARSVQLGFACASGWPSVGFGFGW
jgi:hypothetical protein